MRFLLSVILIAVLAAGAEYFLPWWTIAVASFAISFIMGGKPGLAFLAGFLGVGLLWLIAATLHDAANNHILSARMAVLFHLPGYGYFIMVTVFIGGLVGGLGAWTGALMRPKSPNPIL